MKPFYELLWFNIFKNNFVVYQPDRNKYLDLPQITLITLMCRYI
jgi:hypothetical protein